VSIQTSAQPAVAPAARPPVLLGRLDSIDLLRGAVMVIMALDHVRSFLGAAIDPHDPQGSVALFFTRWVTHFCAPTFIFLAGTGAYLARIRGKSIPQLSGFLLTRGLWLVFLELFVIRTSWWFNFDPRDFGVGVFWPLGWGMVLLSVLVFLPVSTIALFGTLVVVLHNLLDGVTAKQVGLPEWLWHLLHYPGKVGIALPEPLWKITHEAGRIKMVDQISFETGYFLVPWVAVMALGYCFGALLQLEPRTRRTQLIGLGTAMTFAFVFIRWGNGYGDSWPWKKQSTDVYSVMSFLNCTKYPPSLLYLLMTLGPAILFLAAFEKARGWLADIVITYGRVPLFFYLLHIPLIHGGAVVVDLIRYGWSPLAWHGNWEVVLNKVPADYGVSLPMVYVIWLIVLVVLYPACRWFAAVKRRNPGGWLSYL
jgi:uncharacterized membrane protein